MNIDKEIDSLVKIGDWAVSCTTLDQLETLDEFYDRHCIKYEGVNSAKLIYNLGMVSGIILHKKHTINKACTVSK